MAPVPLFLLKAGTCALLVAKTALVARYLYKKYKQAAISRENVILASSDLEQIIDVKSTNIKNAGV